MKVIDLLNKITKGEKVPFRIKVSNVYYHYEIEDNMYYRDDEDKDEFYTDAMITGFVNLNDEVEIVKNLDNLELLKVFIEEHMGYYTKALNNANYCESYVNDLNFIINAINEMSDKE